MGMWQIIKERADQHGWFKIISFHLFILYSTTTYVFDVGSDILLAHRYYAEGDVGWGNCTTSFILIPWILQLFCAVYGLYINFKNDELFLLILSFFNLAPIALLLIAAKRFWCGKFEDSKTSETASQGFRSLEAALESGPQAALQIYIASRMNSLDTILILSIATSLFPLVLHWQVI